MNETINDVQTQTTKRSKWFMLSNGMSQFPSSVIGAVQGGFMMVYYETVIGLNSKYVFLALTIFTIYNAINDPIIGFLVDRNMKFTRKYGRRFPWIVIGIIPWTLSVYFIFNVPDIDPTLSPWPIFGWLLITIFLQDTFGTLVGINVGLLRPELFRTPDERRRFAKYYAPIDIIAVVVGMLLPTLVVEQFADQKMGYGITGLVISIVALTFAILSLPGQRENQEMIDRYYLSDPVRLNFLKSIKEVLKLKSFIVFFIFATCYAITLSLIVPNLNYLTKFVLQVDGGTFFLILIIYLSSTLLSFPFWNKYIKKANNNKKVFVVGALFYCAALLPLTFVVSKYDLMVFTAILGFASGCTTAFTSTVLFPNIVDDFAVHTGKNQKAILLGISGLMRRLSNTIDEGIISLVHNATGFIEGNATYEEMAAAVPGGNMVPIQNGIRLLMGVIPAVILLVGTLVFWKFFPLTPEKERENREKLHELNL